MVYLATFTIQNQPNVGSIYMDPTGMYSRIVANPSTYHGFHHLKDSTIHILNTLQ